MPATWLVQTNLINEDLSAAIKLSAEKLGHTYVGAKITPFMETMETGLYIETPIMTLKSPIIPYGSTTLIKMFDRSILQKDGFFFNQKNLKTSTWVAKLGERMLNHDACVIPLYAAAKLKTSETWFMKPDDDLKDFIGSIVDAAGIENFYNDVAKGGFMFDETIQVVLSKPKNMGWEWRLFMIKNEVITGSSYRLKGMLNQNKPVPERVIQFAQESASIWRPDDVYVMDVCETDDGLKIVEFNCFNASGFYKCDVEKVVDRVSQHVLSL